MKMRQASMIAAAGLLLAPQLVRADHHALAMHGIAKYRPGFTHFDYANPNAPKGGTLKLGHIGTFDSLNPFIVRGLPAAGLGLTYHALLRRSADEPFTLYAHLADRVVMADDRSWVSFRLRRGAKIHDGRDVTVDDIAFSFETLRRWGRPNHRRYYREVIEVNRPQRHTIRFHFAPSGNRELPLILGLMPILPAHAFEARKFDRVSLTPIPGAGPYRVANVVPGRSITYHRLPNYWGLDLPAARGHFNFQSVRYEYFRDRDAYQQALQRGDIHLHEEDDPRRWALGYDFPAARKGKVKRVEFVHRRPAGMYALVWNARRGKFQDPRVRRALGQAFDFDWVNRSFFHGAYRRTTSFFANSELAATGLPAPAEKRLLAPFQSQLPAALFFQPYQPPGDGSLGNFRQRLKLADADLRAAGWIVRDLRRVNVVTGERLTFEIMLNRRTDERLALNLANNLERLGVAVRVRTVDASQYQERLDRFDFDAILHRWYQSLSPGTEQAYYWSSSAAGEAGSRNYPGIRSPAANVLIAHLTGARSRTALVAAARALDRALLWSDHVLPLYHTDRDRVAYWDLFGRPKTLPLYGYRIHTWWQDPLKVLRLDAR